MLGHKSWPPQGKSSSYTLCILSFLLVLEDLTGAPASVSEEDSTAGFCLTLPGKTLYLSPLLAMKKFRKKGNKEGAVASFYKLEAEGLGKVVEVRGARGTSTVSLIEGHFSCSLRTKL